MEKRKIVKTILIFMLCVVFAIEIESKPKKYKVVEPDWNNPQVLTYSYLRTLARKRESYGGFPEDISSRLNGAAVELSGAIMPMDDVSPDGKISTFWLVNPRAMMGGCVFCNPPAMNDMVYIETAKGSRPLKINIEKLYSDIVTVKIKGRLFLGPDSKGGMMYLFRIVRM